METSNVSDSVKTDVSIVTLKLNKTDKKPKNYLCIRNKDGILLVDKGLFSISFKDKQDMLDQGVEIVQVYNSQFTAFL